MFAAAEFGDGDGGHFDGAGGAMADGVDADGFVQKGVKGGVGLDVARGGGDIQGGSAGGGVGEGFAVKGDVGMSSIGFLELLEIFW